MLHINEKKIYPSVDGVRNVIDLLGAGNEKIRALKAEELVDDSVVKRLERRAGSEFASFNIDRRPVRSNRSG